MLIAPENVVLDSEHEVAYAAGCEHSALSPLRFMARLLVTAFS
jgi:hypothetical protein